jgi:hypothetical protein
MKRVLIVAAVAAFAGFVVAPAQAAVTVLSENFEDQGYKGRWTFTPSDAWTRREQGTNHYMAFAGGSRGSAESTKPVRVEDGDKYKIQLRYRHGPARVMWYPYFLSRLEYMFSWVEVSFMWTANKQEDLAFQIVVFPGTTMRLHFDDVLILRCETGVVPTSLGRVKALFK